MPFVSQHKGKTLNLLKQSSKPVPQERKRKKHEIFGNLVSAHDSFSESSQQPEVKSQQQQQQQPMQLGSTQSRPLYYPPRSNMGGDNPNVISNLEDPNYPSGLKTPEDVVMKGDTANFTTITPTRKGDPPSMMPAGRRT